MTVTASAIDRAVRSICAEVAKRIAGRNVKALDETRLWEELACCVLSSQVTYESALAAVREMRCAGIFHDICGTVSNRTLLSRITRILKTPAQVAGRPIRYRFPESRASQLVETRRSLSSAGLTLREVVYGPETEVEKRRRLVSLVCGFGPKQASMFLRATGTSYALAILDRHALKFMGLLSLVDKDSLLGSLNLRRYESLEGRFESYARSLGYPTGYVDWAVWIVMRAMNTMRA